MHFGVGYEPRVGTIHELLLRWFFEWQAANVLAYRTDKCHDRVIRFNEEPRIPLLSGPSHKFVKLPLLKFLIYETTTAE